MSTPDVLELPDHPDAQLYPLGDQEEVENLAVNIAEYGRVEQPFLVADGMVADGRRRKLALRLLRDRDGLRLPYRVEFHTPADGSLFRRILLLNSHRRDSPKGECARPLIERYFREYPAASDREVAAGVNVGRPTVARVRTDLVAAGKLRPPPARTGADGRPRTDSRPRPDTKKAHGEAGTTPPAGTPPANGTPPPPAAGDAWEPPTPGSPEDVKLKEENADALSAERKPRDALGAAVPRRVADALADDLYDELAHSLAYYSKRLNAHPELYARFQCLPAGNPSALKFKDFAEEFIGVLAYHKPYCLCDTCSGAGCPRCFGGGWLSKGQHDEAVKYAATPPEGGA